MERSWNTSRMKNPPAAFSHRADPQRLPKKARLGPSLAAALLDGLFEHPEATLTWVPLGKVPPVS